MYFRINIKNIRILTFLLLILFQFSCSNDHDELGITKPIINSKAQIALQLPSDKTSELRSTTTDNETLITNLSLFIFDSATGNKEFSTRIDIPYTGVSDDIDMSRWVSDQVIMVLNSEILANLDKSRNIHIVSNISENKLASVTNEDSLEAIITDAISTEIAEPSSERPLIMHGVKKDHNFMVDVRASISLVRNVSKVNMTINTTDFVFGGVKYLLAPGSQNLSVKMSNVADRSYIVPALASPSSASYISYNFKIVAPLERENGTTKSAFHSYINENLRTSYDEENNATFVVLQIPYQKEGDTTIKTENYYKISINQENGYKINRNTIYDITLNISSLGGETDASAKLIEGKLNILPWDENTIVSDISQTFLTVKETVFDIGVSKDFYYATNAESADCSLESGASWLTASFDATNNIKIMASGADYTVPRSTSLKIKVKNLTKLITVNQAPIQTTGSIRLSPKTIYLSETSTYKDVALTVDPTSSSWMKIDGEASIASCNNTAGTGNQTLRFTRGTTFDNTIYKFLNKSTLEYDDVKVCNLLLTISEEDTNIPGEAGSYTVSDIVARGGDANWVIKSKSDWITSASNIGGELHFTAEREPNEADRSGSIIIAHVNDPNYAKEIKINQSAKFIKFPEYDYLLVSYDWSESAGADLDIAAEFRGTGISTLDSRPVGYSQGSISYDSDRKKIIEWGGDNQAARASENVVIYMTDFTSENNIQYFKANGIRFVYIDFYATWFGATDVNKPIQFKMKSFKGGIMVKNPMGNRKDPLYGTFTNPTGILGLDWVGYRKITSVYSTFGKFEWFRTHFTKMATITYDIEKNETKAEIIDSPTRSAKLSSKSNIDGIPMLSGETKEEYAERLDKYRKQHKQ